MARRDGRFVARVPTALVLAGGYVYTALVLTTGERIARNGLTSDLRWVAVIGSVLFAVWHIAGYLGYVTDGPRKAGYAASAAWMGGFATVLAADEAFLGAGYVAIGCAMALASYWKYPRRSEG